MQITLYNVTSDKRRINKPLDNVIGVYSNVKLKENTSVANPVFLVNGLSNNQFNYLYCPYLNRYYFKTDVIYCKGQLWEIHCHTDVLMSFKDDILEHDAYILRQEKKFFKSNQAKNGIFTDANYPVRADCFIKTIDIGDVADGAVYYLTVNGGVQ